MYGAAYGLSYLLDPRYLGQHLLPHVRCNLEELLVNTPADDITPIDDDRKEKLFEQLTAFLVYATQTPMSFASKCRQKVRRQYCNIG